jgi:lysophospholipase L1-like esterase
VTRGRQRLFRAVTVLLVAALATLLLRAVPWIRGAVFPTYVQGPGFEVTGQKFLYDRLLGWRNVPGFRARTFGQPLTINSHGLRDREYTVAKPADVTRILVLGDSYTWGYGVADGDLYTEVLEERLNERVGGFEVLNAGVSGWGTDQEYLWFREEGVRYEPDIVVLTFFFNDLDEVVSSTMYGAAKPVFLDTGLALGNVPVPPPWKKAEPVVPDADPFDLVAAILFELDRLCAATGSRLVVLKFGNILLPDNPRLRAMEHGLESRLAERPELAYLDLDEAFAAAGLVGRQLVSLPDGHWNVRGHRETAAALERFLFDERLVPVTRWRAE